MNISQYNYEAYFLDYYEGKLDAEANRELMDFLAQHPELKQEFESFEAVTLNDLEEVKFENKESLKKFVAPVNANNFDEVAVEYIEGTLSPALSTELLTFVKLYPEYEKQLSTYKLTKLSPDTSIFFEDKKSLKRRGRVAYYYWSAAASVAILIAGYFILTKPAQPVINVASINTLPADTTHIHVKQSNTNTTVVQHNVVPAKTFVIRKQHNPLPVVNKTEPVIAVVKQNDASQQPTQVNTPVINQKDSTIKPDHVVFDSPKDTINNNTFAQHSSSAREGRGFDTVGTVKNPVVTFASNAVKSLGKIFKRGGVGFSKYYSKDDANKVIAYQFTLGDNRYTLAKK